MTKEDKKSLRNIAKQERVCYNRFDTLQMLPSLNGERKGL